MANLDSLRRQLEQKVQATARTTAQGWESDPKRTAPYEDGEPRDSIEVTSKPTANGAEIDAQIGVIYAWQAREQWDEQRHQLPDRLQRAWRGTT
jgi:hypothetical protein